MERDFDSWGSIRCRLLELTSRMDPAPSVDPNNSPKNSLILQNDTANEDSVHIAATALNDMRSASSHPVASPTPPPPGQFQSTDA